MDFRVDAPPVNLQFGLTGTACTNAASQTGKHQALPANARQIVFQLGKLDLQLACLGIGTLCKDIKDQRCTIQHLDTQQLFEIMLLRRRELIIQQ